MLYVILMVVHILDKSIRISLCHMEEEKLFSQMAVNIKANGMIAICKVKAYLNGKMAHIIRVIIFMVRNKEKELLFMAMATDMRVTGKKGNNMVKEFCTVETINSYVEVSGIMDNLLSRRRKVFSFDLYYPLNNLLSINFHSYSRIIITTKSKQHSKHSHKKFLNISSIFHQNNK